MEEKIHASLFILCLILCQGIIGVTSEHIAESNSHVRRRRVINLEPGGDIPVPREDAPFVGNIRQLHNNATICLGAILSKHTVITSAALVALLDVGSMKILVGSAYSYRGEHHDVIAKHLHYDHEPNSDSDGIALLIVEEGFVFNVQTKPIALHTGTLLAGTSATIFGWGCNSVTPRGTNYRYRLRSITLPIMHHRECVNLYRNRHVISDKEICTYNANKRCGHTDIGAPLVVDNKLAGIHIWTGYTPGHINPDVYLMVQDVEYSTWIRNNII